MRFQKSGVNFKSLKLRLSDWFLVLISDQQQQRCDHAVRWRRQFTADQGRHVRQTVEQFCS